MIKVVNDDFCNFHLMWQTIMPVDVQGSSPYLSEQNQYGDEMRSFQMLECFLLSLGILFMTMYIRRQQRI
jgi:hypothetical protein